ncbi:MAG: endonuclease III domain-containing protein [Candidatus Omnitrophota bacterium]
MKDRLELIYRRLYSYFGAQDWWPASNSFEVIVGAILTQNTSWQNVEKAIDKIKANGPILPKRLYSLPEKKLAGLIKSAGYYNLKAKRLRNFLSFFLRSYNGSIKKMSLTSLGKLREELLSVNGIGPETADSILLYAFNRPIFVIDAYTKRILLRHKIIREDFNYCAIQNIFMKHLKRDAKLFNEYHALLVRLGKEFCLKKKPRCQICPLKCNDQLS